MLREGRKKKLDVVVSTQFTSHYDKDEIRVLQQAGNMVIFRPTPQDCRQSAKLIDLSEIGCWEKIIKGLRKGEAVLKGSYTIDGRSKLSFDPIVVRILETGAENREKILKIRFILTFISIIMKKVKLRIRRWFCYRW